MSHSIKRFYPVILTGGLFLFPLTSLARFEDITLLAEQAVGVINTLLFVVLSIAVLVFSWGIIKYITAAGDAAKVKEARSFIVWGLIGIFILVAVLGLVNFLVTGLGFEETGSVKPPTLPARP